jgi:Family of unknown function (DUF6263)
MMTNQTKDGCERWSRPVVSPFLPASVLLVAACVFGASAAPAGSAEVLRWKFKPGETLRFSVEQKLIMSMKSADTERKSNRTQNVEMSWKILGVGSDGSAEITQKIERIRLREESPPLMTLDFDSAAGKPDQPGYEAVTRQLKSQVGAEFTFKMKPTGEITDIQLSETTLKGLREPSPDGPDPAAAEKALKESLLQSSPPSFPDGPVEVGKTWTSKPARVPLPFATLVMERTFSNQGPDPKSPNLQLVGIEVTAKIEPVEGADVKAVIRRQEGRGSMTLDSDAGKVVNVRLSQKFEMGVTLMGQTIEQSTEMNTSMSLVP